MERCRGTTKSGSRCKRSVRDGTLYCATHVGQAETAGDGDPSAERTRERNPLDVIVALAVAAVAVGAALTFRRLFRFP